MQNSSLSPRKTAATDIAVCRAMLRENSRTFFAASLLLPRRVREPASALYAFCRLADDAVDLEGARTDAVDSLRERLHLAYEGRPLDIAADRAFADVIARFELPRVLPEALLEGFEWDAQGRRYDDLSGLNAYAARVAGTVGAMMAVLMGTRSRQAAARACDLGVAMQLSNIARDVGEDARNGRLYLPGQWLLEVGIEPDGWLRQPVFTPQLGAVIQRLLQAADVLYGQVAQGVAQLPASCQPGINAARFLYAEIGREVERNGMDSVSRRAVVPAARKAQLLTRALVTSAVANDATSPAPLPETRFLVDAVAAMAAVSAATGEESGAREVPWWNIHDRAVWLIELFERLERMERREQLGRSAGPN